ncbi:FAD-dependent oxidoreductase [Capnocytophaga granulosa]|jgi:oxidoreductase FAD/NAD(P)-binding domain protein
MKTYNSIIIGSGLGGLTAGALLALWGKKVLVLEQHYIPGGCATAFKRKDYLMEVGLHEIDGLHEKDFKRPILEMLDVFKEVEFLKVPEFYYVRKGDFSYVFPGGDQAKTKLIQDFPEEREAIEGFFVTIERLYKEMHRMPRGKWLSRLLYPLIPLLYPTVVKTSGLNVGEWLDKQFKDERLKSILTANLGYYTDDPYSLSLMYFLVAQGSYLKGGGHFVKGGSQVLSNYLVHFIEQHEGQVLTGKYVEEILIEDNHAVGVIYRDTFSNAAPKEKLYADTIVANAAQPIVARMLPEPQRSALQKKVGKLKPACSLLSIYLGFNTDLKTVGVKHYSTIILNKNKDSLKQMRADAHSPWSERTFTFVNYGVIDSQLCPKGKSVGVICTIDHLVDWEGLSPEAYHAQKEVVAQTLLTRLEAEYPGILSHLEYCEVATAKTIQRYTLNPEGTAYGYVQSIDQMGPAREKAAASPVKNLYFASAWAPSGGGYSGAIYSGYFTAEAMKKAVKWGTYAPSMIEDTRRVKLLDKEIIADNTILLTFEKPKNMTYQAGQYAILKLDTPKYTHLDMPLRPLSMVSIPSQETLCFAMRLSDSAFKRSVAEMFIGDTATIFAPMGNFILRPSQHMVFFAAGIGVTPIIAMLKELEQQRFAGQVTLCYSCKRETAAAFHKDLQHISLANYTYLPVFTEYQKRIDSIFVSEHIPALLESDCYIVGTHVFIQGIEQMLLRKGVKQEAIVKDDFK